MKREEVKIVAEDIKEILAETIADYEQRTEKILQPAHIERSIIQTYTYRELLVRKGINEAFRQTFPQTATSIALDLCGEPMGCYRLKDQAARCVLRFSVSGSHDTVSIPKGTIVAVDGQLSFSTLTDDVISSTMQYVDIEAIANITGSRGNGWEIGRIKTLKSRLNTDLTVTASNIDEPTGGVEVESDDDYRKRILLAPEAFTTCGSIAAYEYHARSVSQVISDIAIKTPVGGTVKVTVLTKQGLPSATLINQIQTYLSAEKRRPLCDKVLVEPAQKIAYNVVARLDLLATAVESDVKAQAEQALRTYLSTRTKQLGVDVVPLDIQAALKVDGVYNITLTQPALTEVMPEQWANCESISITINEVRKDG